MPQKKQYKLDYLPESWAYYRNDIQKMRDVCDGLRRCDRSRYLIQKTAEKDEHYRTRLKLAVFENRVEAAISEFAGVLSMNHSFLPETPDEITYQQTDVDGCGTDFGVWLNSLLQKLLRDGCVGWFVGWDENTQNWKFIYVDPMSLRAPIVLTDNGVPRLFGFTIETTEQVVNGYSTEEQVVYYRHELIRSDDTGNPDNVYYQYTRFIKGKDGRGDVDFIPDGDPVIPTIASGERLTEIPFVWVSLGDDRKPLSFDFSFFTTLADINILQYNKVSELNTAESNCNMLTLVRKHAGEVPEYPSDIYTGANAIIEVGDAQFGGAIEYLEPNGRAIEITHQRNNDRDATMDALAKQFITGDAVERTKYQVQVEITSVQARLLTLVANLQDAIRKSFSFVMDYASPLQTEDTGGITINSEAIRPPVQVDELRLWQEWTDLGYISKYQFMQLLQTSGAFPIGFVLDDEGHDQGGNNSDNNSDNNSGNNSDNNNQNNSEDNKQGDDENADE